MVKKTHMDAFQNEFSGSIFGQGGTLTNSGGGKIWYHKQCKAWINRGRIHEFWVHDIIKRFCIHGADKKDCEFNKTTQAKGGSNLVPTNGYV